MEFPFWKMHGAGNGYVFLYQKKKEIKEPELFAKFVSNPRTGIGSDGLILIEASDIADAKMIMYNADGSRGRMCGNGIRCLGKYLFDHKLAGREQRIETDAGLRSVLIKENAQERASVRVDMERPQDAEKITLYAKRESFSGYSLSMGNPHFVLRAEDCDKVPISRTGPLLECHPYFPAHTNVEFVTPVDKKTCRMRVWERGSGETMACGTGACAAVVALTLQGFFTKGREIRVILPGGTLMVSYEDDGRVWLEGPAETVCKGVVYWGQNG